MIQAKIIDLMEVKLYKPSRPLSSDEIDYEIEKAFMCNKAVNDFIMGKIDEDTFLDILEHYEQDIEEYVEVAHSNLDLIIA